MSTKNEHFLPHQRLDGLLQALRTEGYRCVGPQVKDGTIQFETLTRADQLPWGVVDDQSPGTYRLKKTSDKRAFGHVNGPQAIKPELFKPREILWEVARDENGRLNFHSPESEFEMVAMLGVRPCDLAAMAIQDKVFCQGAHADTRYQERRDRLFLICVNCTRSSNNCFCVSAGGYPSAKENFDIVMTEVKGGFVVDVGTEKGQAIIDTLSLAPAKSAQTKSATEGIKKAADMQTKRLPLSNDGPIRKLLFDNLEHPQWDDVAERCLSCGNCTQVCPTCFCCSDYQSPNLDGKDSSHVREWDSCFTTGHSYIAGMVIRSDIRSRYRQWMMHKLGSWHDQFNVSGCVGCGRCITWCPTWIDITEETAAIAEQPGAVKKE